MDTFNFYTERRLVQLTGRTASNLASLLEVLNDISGSSIFYHTHHLFLSHHFERPIVFNEFATWVGEALQESALAERLAAVDLLAFTSIRQLRNAIAALIQTHLDSRPGQPRPCPPGREFHFCKSKSFIMPTHLSARTPEEFFRILPSITNISLYFHFLEARLRLERRTNDFSHWLRGLGQTALAGDIDHLDPYAVTLDELKQQILQLGAAHGHA